MHRPRGVVPNSRRLFLRLLTIAARAAQLKTSHKPECSSARVAGAFWLFVLKRSFKSLLVTLRPAVNAEPTHFGQREGSRDAPASACWTHHGGALVVHSVATLPEHERNS